MKNSDVNYYISIIHTFVLNIELLSQKFTLRAKSLVSHFIVIASRDA